VKESEISLPTNEINLVLVEKKKYKNNINKNKIK